MRFLARAPDLALAMWAVFPMPRGNPGHSSTRINAGEFPHGPLRRLAVSHVELTTWIGGPGLFLHFFHAMHAQTRTVFCDPNRLFLGPYGKKSRIRTTDLLQKTSLSYRRSCFFGRFFRRSYVWGGVGSQSRAHTHKLVLVFVFKTSRPSGTNSTCAGFAPAEISISKNIRSTARPLPYWADSAKVLCLCVRCPVRPSSQRDVVTERARPPVTPDLT